MLKVNNKKVIQDLAKTTYKANKKRNLLTIFISLVALDIIIFTLHRNIYWIKLLGYSFFKTTKNAGDRL